MIARDTQLKYWKSSVVHLTELRDAQLNIACETNDPLDFAAAEGYEAGIASLSRLIEKGLKKA